MKKSLFTILAVLVLTSLVLSPAAAPRRRFRRPQHRPQFLPRRPSLLSRRLSLPKAPEVAAPTEYKPATDAPKKIAFFVSDLSECVPPGPGHRGAEYAKEKYGAEVIIFDGKSDSATMTPNVDQSWRRDGCRDAAHLGLRCGEARRHGMPWTRASS